MTFAVIRNFHKSRLSDALATKILWVKEKTGIKVVELDRQSVEECLLLFY